MEYSVKIVPEDDAFVVSSRDLPELNSVGYSLEEALKEAVDGIETVFMICMEERRPIPAGTPAQDGEYMVRLPVQAAVKATLYNEMLAQGITKAELARRLGWQQKQADRLWSLHHATKLESIEDAFEAIGKHLELAVV